MTSSDTHFELLECELVGDQLRVGNPLRVAEYRNAGEMGRAAARILVEQATHDGPLSGVQFVAVEGGVRRGLTLVEQAAVEAGAAQEGVTARDYRPDGSDG